MLRAKTFVCKRWISTPSYTNAQDDAFAIASNYLNAQRTSIMEKLKTENDSEKKQKLELELGFSDYKKHAEYANGKVDLKNPLFAKMHYNRFKTDLMPQMLKLGHEFKIFQQVFPEEIKPNLNLEINFSNTNWLAAYGHPLPPNWALYSPRFAISTNEHRKRYFTLIMMDLDRPNEKQQYYEEWCHWLIANIPVEYRLEVDGGSSPFLAPGKGNSLKNAHFTPDAPAEPPVIPGETILPYIPPHPPLSDPRKVHRLLFTLLESKNIGEKIDVEEIKSRINVSEDGTERPELRSNARSSLGTTYKFIRDFDLQVQGYGFLNTVWNIYTPDIFTRLNIHEPVYGTLSGNNNDPKIRQFVEAARHYKSNLSSIPLSELSRQELNELNLGHVTSKFEPIILTKERMEIQEMIKNSEEKARKRKMNRITVTGAAGIVRSRENIKDKKFY